MSIYGHKFDFLKESKLGQIGVDSPDETSGERKAAKNYQKEIKKNEEDKKLEEEKKEFGIETMKERQARLAREENIRQAAQKIEGKENWRIQ